MKDLVNKYFFAIVGKHMDRNNIEIMKYYLAGKIIEQCECKSDYKIKVISSNVFAYKKDDIKDIFLVNNKAIKVKYFVHMHELLALLI